MRGFHCHVAVAVAALCSVGCESSPPILTEGRWIGIVVPQDSPEERLGVYYRVSYVDGELTVLVGVDGIEARPARQINLTSDSLHFELEDSESGIRRRCTFGLQSNGSYEGLCSGDGPGSGYFTMKPPDPSGGVEA